MCVCVRVNGCVCVGFVARLESCAGDPSADLAHIFIIDSGETIPDECDAFMGSRLGAFGTGLFRALPGLLELFAGMHHVQD